MPSIQEIKRRKQGIQSISQITKAMKLVSASKLQKAKDRAEDYAPYSNHLLQTAQTIFEEEKEESSKKAVIVISSNRGLAGGFHSNLLKVILNSKLKKEDMLLITLGERTRDGLIRNGYGISKDYSTLVDRPASEIAETISAEILKYIEKKETGEVFLVYTIFKNTVTQIPTMLKLFPAGKSGTSNNLEAPMNYEPDKETVLKKFMPFYFKNIIYGAILQSAASEHGARMQAMDSASKNAGDMLEELSLQYNRARQGTITRELTEIISGVEAIE